MDRTYQLQDCEGGAGGLLLPTVPEPSTLRLITAATAFFLMVRRRSH